VYLRIFADFNEQRFSRSLVKRKIENDKNKKAISDGLLNFKKVAD